MMWPLICTDYHPLLPNLKRDFVQVFDLTRQIVEAPSVRNLDHWIKTTTPSILSCFRSYYACLFPALFVAYSLLVVICLHCTKKYIINEKVMACVILSTFLN
jgi:hypothetical protein